MASPGGSLELAIQSTGWTPFHLQIEPSACPAHPATTHRPDRLLPLRAGLASGPVVMRDGDIFGRNVNLALRIVSHATPGTLLVDEATCLVLEGEGRIEKARKTGIELKGYSGAIALHILAPGKDGAG